MLTRILSKTQDERTSASRPDNLYLDQFGPAACRLVSRIQERSVEAVLVASGWPGEGTTTMTLGLAHALTQRYGARVLVVELNFARPILAKLFSTEEGKSLAGICAGLHNSMSASTEVDTGLAVLPAGTVDPGLRRALVRILSQLVDDARGHYDIILADTPPVLGSAEALIAGKVIPHLLLVAEAGRASIESVQKVRAILDSQGIALVGSLLNKEKTYMPDWLYRRLK